MRLLEDGVVCLVSLLVLLFLAAGCYLLLAGCWMSCCLSLPAGCCSMVTSNKLIARGQWLLLAACWLLLLRLLPSLKRQAQKGAQNAKLGYENKFDEHR